MIKFIIISRSRETQLLHKHISRALSYKPPHQPEKETDKISNTTNQTNTPSHTPTSASTFTPSPNSTTPSPTSTSTSNSTSTSTSTLSPTSTPSSAPSHSPSDPSPSNIQDIYLSFQSSFNYHKRLKKLRRTFNLLKIPPFVTKFTIFVIIVVGIVIVLYWESVTYFLGKKTAQVATEGLDNTDVQHKLEKFSKVLLDDLMKHYSKDEETQLAATNLLDTVVSDPQTIASIINLFDNVMADPSFEMTVEGLAKYVAIQVLNHPRTQYQLVDLIETVIKMEHNRAILLSLLKSLFHDPYIVSELQSLVSNVISGDPATEQVKQIAHSITKWLLSNPSMIALARQFLKDTFNDPSMQEIIGNAMSNSAKHHITSSLYTVTNSSVSTSTTTITTTPSTASLQTELLSIPEYLFPTVSEIFLRDIYQQITKEYGLQCTQDGLEQKKQQFLQKVEETKSKLPPPAQYYFDRLTQQHIGEIFKQDQELIFGGGESALISHAKQKRDKVISHYESYLQNLGNNLVKKQSQDYLFGLNLYEQIWGKAEEEEIKLIKKRVEELKREKRNEQFLLKNELNSIMVKDALLNFYEGNLQQLLQSHRESDNLKNVKGDGESVVLGY